MAANTPVTSPVALIPDVSRFLAEVRTRFVANRYGQLDEQDFLEVFELAAQVFADWRHLTVKRVKGATYPVPYTDNLGLVPPDYRILGMQAEAVHGVDSATGAAGVTAPPVFFALIRDSAGPVTALLDAEPTTTLTVKARWVRISGTDEEQLDSFELLALEDHDYAAGDVRKWVFAGGETRLVQWRADSVGFVHPEPTGQDDDPVYAIFAPITPQGSSQADLDALTARVKNLELAGSIWEFIGDPGDNNLSQGPFDMTSNTISGNQNTFYGFNGGITFGPICNDNRLEANVFNVTFGTRCSFNHIGAESVNVQFGDNCQHNDIGADIGTVTFGQDCQYNTIGASCTSITLGDSCTHITMTPQCSDIVLGDGCQRLTFTNCNGTSNAPLVIPAGTTDAEYRDNALVVAGTAGPGGPATDANALPAPKVAGLRTVSEDVALNVTPSLKHNRGFVGPNTGAGDRNFLQGNWELRAYGADADYRAFVDANGYAIVRKDYMEQYVEKALGAGDRLDLFTIPGYRTNTVVLEQRCKFTNPVAGANLSSVSAQVIKAGTTNLAAVSAPRTGTVTQVIDAINADIAGLSDSDAKLLYVRFITLPVTANEEAHILLTTTPL